MGNGFDFGRGLYFFATSVGKSCAGRGFLMPAGSASWQITSGRSSVIRPSIVSPKKSLSRAAGVIAVARPRTAQKLQDCMATSVLAHQC